MALEALFGFAGVVLGSLATSVLTIYRETLVNRHDVATRERQYERERRDARNAFQRESILAMQAAVSALIGAAYEELDRLLLQYEQSGQWSVRKWETPTAKGWSAAILSLESTRARVFDEGLRVLAERIRVAAGDSVWATNLESAKAASQPIEALQTEFHAAVTRLLPSLY